MNISSPSGSLIRHDDGVLVAEHRLESLAEDRFHPAKVTHELFQRPLPWLRSGRERRLVKSRRQTPNFGGLGSQALDERQVNSVFVVMIVMVIVCGHGGHYRM